MLNSEKIYCIPGLLKTQHPENQTLISSTSWLKSNKGVPHGKIHDIPISAFRIFFHHVLCFLSKHFNNPSSTPPSPPAVVYIMYGN